MQGTETGLSAEEKLESLKGYLKCLGSAAVAFSGGVDSTFLLKAAQEALGERAAAVTVRSCLFPERELKEAEAFCRREGIRQYMLDTQELKLEGFRDNPENRCYLCKRNMFERILETAAAAGLAVVAEGSNADDEGDYRPGMAAIAELGIKSPLRHVRLTKAEIRALSESMGLPTWNKQSFACLASRFVYGEEITEEKLSMVGRAEQLLAGLGFSRFRVRIHGRMARIEVEPAGFERLMQEEVRERVVKELKGYGFSYVALDLQGYRTGSMNETLRDGKNGLRRIL